ncbi:MAG: efflux RND transporter periplasmic adaptor subunit [Verrucomicrobiia bacterium]
MNAETPTISSSPPKLSRAALVALMLIVAAVIAGLLPRLRHRSTLAIETRELAVPTVAVVSPMPGKPTPGLPLPAEIKPWIEAPIYARASGYLKRWLADLGARVEPGQLLAEIETPELDQELERARHQLAEAEAALALAKTTAERYAGLLKTASVSEQETAEKEADFALKTATVNAARANVRRLEELQGFARVAAPFAGVVTARSVDVGDLVTAGSGKELFRLAQTDKLRVYVRVPQAEAMNIKPGQLAELVIPEMPNRVFTGTVARTAGAISPESRTLLTELEVDNSKGEILAGSFGQVRFLGLKRPPTLTLPGNALLFRAEGPQVGVVQPDGTVALRPVKLGRDFGAMVEVVAGVSTNDQVVLNPPDSLADGSKVRVAAAPNSETVESANRK